MELKVKLAKWIYHNLGGSEKGDHCPPGDGLKLRFGELDEGVPMHTVRTSNDGHELWLAYTHSKGWLAHYWAEEAHRLAWFILWDWWVKATWFGLKRKLWYWALHTDLMSQSWYRERYGDSARTTKTQQPGR